MKRSDAYDIVKLPPIPKWQKTANGAWFQFLMVLFFLIVCTVVGFAIANAHETEATYPDPRVEWVTVQIGGMRMCSSDSTHISEPLPAGSWMCVPVYMKSNRPTRRDS